MENIVSVEMSTRRMVNPKSMVKLTTVTWNVEGINVTFVVEDGQINSTESVRTLRFDKLFKRLKLSFKTGCSVVWRYLCMRMTVVKFGCAWVDVWISLKVWEH